MKKVIIERFGVPEEVARCVDAPDPGAPGPGEVVFDVLAFPINPADLWLCRGGHRLQPALPATPGAECVGRVIAIGAGVTRVAPGDLVINLARENWAARRRVREADAIVVPRGIDVLQAAMLRINPATALLLLTDVATLAPGDWVIQSVANSSVGRLIIRFAAERGWRTVNVVRRDALFDELRALGATTCVVDGPDLAERVREATGGASIRFGIDAAGGQATARLAECVADHGAVCNYGSMSREDPVMPRSAVVYRGVSLTGFSLGRFIDKRSVEDIHRLYATLAQGVLGGRLTVPVRETYPIDAIRDALAHAQQPGRDGKILVLPNGTI